MLAPPAISEDELKIRFVYHAPSAEQSIRYGAIREKALEFARFIVANSPTSREQSNALTHLDECVMNANASIARRESPTP